MIKVLLNFSVNLIKLKSLIVRLVHLNCVFRLMFRFLYKQLLLFFDADPETKENCIFESSAESHQLQLKSKISLHLYTNQCPEGAAKNFYFKYDSLLFPLF